MEGAACTPPSSLVSSTLENRARERTLTSERNPASSMPSRSIRFVHIRSSSFVAPPVFAAHIAALQLQMSIDTNSIDCGVCPCRLGKYATRTWTSNGTAGWKSGTSASVASASSTGPKQEDGGSREVTAASSAARGWIRWRRARAWKRRSQCWEDGSVSQHESAASLIRTHRQNVSSVFRRRLRDGIVTVASDAAPVVRQLRGCISVISHIKQCTHHQFIQSLSSPVPREVARRPVLWSKVFLEEQRNIVALRE